VTDLYRFKLRRGTAAQWASADPVLAEGEPGVELGTGQMKLGDGTTPWTELPWTGVADDASMTQVAQDPDSSFRGELMSTIDSRTEQHAGEVVPPLVSQALYDDAELRGRAEDAVELAAEGLDILTQQAGDVRYESGAAIARRVANKLTGVKVAVIFRHDDIQASALQYLPIYAARGHRASWYVSYNHMGSEERGIPHATADDVEAIHAAGHEIGSHTMNHFYFDGSTEAQRRTEMAESKAALEAMLGGGYVCETFAYPGNMHGIAGPRVPYEVLDYYLLGTSGVPQAGDAGGNSTGGTIDVGAFLAEYTNPIVGATPEETRTKAAAKFAEWKGRQGVTFYTVQTHNTSELPLDQFEALLDVIDADPQIVTLTMREVAHYVRTFQHTTDARYYAPPGRTSGDAELEFQTSLANRAGVSVDRKGIGAAFRARRNGQEASTLDTSLVIRNADPTDGGTRLEAGHTWTQYSADNTRRFRAQVTPSGIWHLIGTAMEYLTLNGFGLQARRDGRTIQASTATNTEVFTVDTTRQSIYLAPRTELPVSGRVGEMCNLNGVLHICYEPGHWTVVGTQEPPATP